MLPQLRATRVQPVRRGLCIGCQKIDPLYSTMIPGATPQRSYHRDLCWSCRERAIAARPGGTLPNRAARRHAAKQLVRQLR